MNRFLNLIDELSTMAEPSWKAPAKSSQQPLRTHPTNMHSGASSIPRASQANEFRQEFASAYAAVNYTVPGIVPVLAQPSSMACWATVYTMLYSWKRQQSLTIEAALGALGQKWLNIYTDNTGLPGSEKSNFVRAAGLIAEPPMNPSMQGWEEMLRNYGPLWLTTNENPGQGWAIHARILVGIHGDGTASGTRFKIIDPAGGRQYEESVATFIPKYEDEVRRTGYLRIQILHWPAQASHGQSYAYGHSYTYAANAINFQVQGVPSIRQPSANTCWAAATTTLFGWYRGNDSLNIHDFLNELSNKTFVNLFDQDVNSQGKHRGINVNEARQLYDLLGLQTIDQFNPTVGQWEQYLRDFGPLYINIGFRQGNAFHAVVIEGIEGNGTPTGTKLYIHDPLSIISSPIVFQQLIDKYETGAGWPMQIVHFPRGEDMVSHGNSLSGSAYSYGHQTLDPIEVTISPARREQILRSAGWKKINMTITIKDFRGEPLLGHRLFAEFQAPQVAAQNFEVDVRGGSAIFSNLWVKPSGTLRLLAVSTAHPTLAPSGVVQYTLPQSNQLRFDVHQDKMDVEVTATSSQEAASKVGATGSVGIEFQVFSAGGEISREDSGSRGESVSRRYTVRLPKSVLIISSL